MIELLCFACVAGTLVQANVSHRELDVFGNYVRFGYDFEGLKCYWPVFELPETG